MVVIRWDPQGAKEQGGQSLELKENTNQNSRDVGRCNVQRVSLVSVPVASFPVGRCQQISYGKRDPPVHGPFCRNNTWASSNVESIASLPCLETRWPGRAVSNRISTGAYRPGTTAEWTESAVLCWTDTAQSVHCGCSKHTQYTVERRRREQVRRRRPTTPRRRSIDRSELETGVPGGTFLW
jgi:hypothetical protein